ncbi:DUF2812 domain-containing protein [Bacillus sp. 31A1R]|uniref:DUF2812 domain-containing protein n=1 Tax=Robertmurraya mangrovi TaxID=3098077 RepID=A0ABU5J2T7_9BACI|nr:DUF2812 domain-containing protein [Bacillus sp. 31A1R]MDZ5473729.1 DUF2812 domain-containing protein [Bacillus sp. 31A1R]
MEETKKVTKVFFAWQDEKEENWLNDMASKGWMLKGVNKLTYTFIKSDIHDPIIYKLDYRSTRNDDFEEYKGIFEDAGWEHVGMFGDWHYFKGKSSCVGQEDIYSDSSSKIEKYKNLLYRLIIGLICMVIISLSFMFKSIESLSFLFILFRIIYLVFIGLICYSIYKTYGKIQSLNKSL